MNDPARNNLMVELALCYLDAIEHFRNGAATILRREHLIPMLSGAGCVSEESALELASDVGGTHWKIWADMHGPDNPQLGIRRIR
jgi:hypothetical protein